MRPKIEGVSVDGVSGHGSRPGPFKHVLLPLSEAKGRRIGFGVGLFRRGKVKGPLPVGTDFTGINYPNKEEEIFSIEYPYK